VELLVVFAIMGLMLALASPRIQNALPGFELRTAARELAAAMRETRARAVRTGDPVGLVLDLSAGRYSIGTGGESRKLPGDLEFEVTTTQEDIDAERRRARFRFYPDGTALGGGVTLKQGDSAYRVDIDWMTGRVQLRE
jgi:general secretion pathway protein H